MSAAALQGLLDEVGQRHRVRRRVLQAIEAATGRRVLSYFVSFADPAAMIDHGDPDVLEEALRQLDLPGPGLTLLLNAPGGDGLAAERIAHLLRTYSGSDLEVIVPRMAKSAATMICFGANVIWMGETGELGPIDPQVGWMDGERPVRMSARELITSYETLLQRAESCQGNIEPYIQQLSRYDARLIETYRTAEDLSASIAVGLLSSGMMRGEPEEAIRERLRPFLDIERTESHARAIHPAQARACGLRVEVLPLRGALFSAVWELYLRTSHAVDNTGYSKLVETAAQSYAFGPKEGERGPEITSA